MSRYDIAIVGGGLVGASLAVALSPLGLRIALLEAVSFRTGSQPSYDDRTLALSDSSCKILAGLGLWEGVREHATAIREVHVRQLGEPGRVVMDPAELGLECFGHVVEARRFGKAVMQRLPELENVDFICPATVGAVEADSDGAAIRYSLEGQEYSLEAGLLVGADGARSFVRGALGIEADEHDYGQTAVICNITPEQQHKGRAFECFTPSGPFAVMPHVNGRCGLIWCVATEEADGLLTLPENEFLARANTRFGDQLGRFIKLGQRSAYPLHLVRAREDVRPGAVILGNAAHAIHPIGAQGFNLGLRDAATLAELIAGQVRRDPGARLGDPALLKAYSDWRVADHDGTIAYSDGLARLFANPTGMARIARGAGMLAHAVFPPLRRRLALGAMGYRGKTPRLALGQAL